jgi:hypothetical protein
MGKLKQFFCVHDFRIPKKYYDAKTRIKLINENGCGFSRIHKCIKCGKEKIIK